MAQWNVALLEQCDRQWKRAMATTDNFSAEIRPKDAVDRHEEGGVAAFSACMGSSTARVEKALQCIESRGYLSPEMDALDIGSGNGVFTLPFAERYRTVTSLDISEAMQNEIRRQAEEKGLANIRYISANWRDLDVDVLSLRDQFDLALCSINPRGVCDISTLNKMNAVSRGGCCLMTFAGRGQSNHGGELQRLILGRSLTTTGGNDIIFPFNAAYHLGGEPDLAYATVGWERRQSPEAAIEGICYGYWRFADITPAIRDRVARYVYDHLEDGEYVDRVENLIGITVWDAWRIKQKGLA